MRLPLRIRSRAQKTHNNRVECARFARGTPKEVETYCDILFSRRGVDPGPKEAPELQKTSFLSALGAYALMAAVVLFLLYLCFDVYRVAMWLWSLILQ